MIRAVRIQFSFFDPMSIRIAVAITLLAGPIAASAATPKKEEPKVALTAAQKQDYTKVIQPIFDANCISCHGAKKVKGKLRLDTLEATLKGGKKQEQTVETIWNGRAIVITDDGARRMHSFSTDFQQLPV